MGRAVVGIAAGVALAGCGGVPTVGVTHEARGPVAAPESPAPELPRPLLVDYQLGGGYDAADGVTGVVRDSTEEPAAGLWSVCYVNGFQTQPGERDRWLTEHADLVLHDDDGAPVTDPGWPDELLLDTSTADRRERIATVVGSTIQTCAAQGFDAVELDNLDSFERSDGRLTADDALDLLRRYAEVAHGLGLAVGQKNAVDLSLDAHLAGADFVVVEECHRWDECAAYTEVYGADVVAVEYADDLRGTWADVCADPTTPSSVVLRDRDLAPRGDPAHTFATCP